MKTLQDYINESILDDKEVLIDNTIKDFKNPFYFVTNLMSNKVSLIDYEQEINKSFRKFIKDLKPSYPIKIFIYSSSTGIKLTLNENIKGYDPLIILRPGYLWPKNDDPFGFPGDQKMVIFFTKPFKEDYVHYGFKNETDYIHWIKMISKKYNLKQSKNDKYVYYI